MPALNRTSQYALLVLILLVGLWLRLLPIEDRTPAQITAGGDSREYIQLAEFFLDTDQVAPGNRFPGYSFLLMGLFTVLPFSHEVISVSTSLALSIVSLGLLWLLASRIAGSWAGFVVTALAAVQPEMVQSAHRGLSEELFLVTFLVLLSLYWILRERETISWQMYGGLALLGGWMSLIRPDSAYAIIPLAAMLFWREKARGLLPALARILPILVLPFLLPKLSQAWMVGLGVQDLDMRVGRAGLWMEFMIGRMPYKYMFYKETSMQEWIFGHHSFGELAVIGIKSSVRNLLALGQAVWGQVPFLVAILGAFAYVRKQREWALPLAVPLAVLPQWALMSLWPESDVGRYSIRVVPLILIFLAMGASQIATWLQTRIAVGDAGVRLLPTGVVLLAMAPALIPASLYASVRPTVDILMHERTEYLPKVSQVHPVLAAEWYGFIRKQQTAAETQSSVESLLRIHDAYAPTHLALGLLSLQQQRFDEAAQHLERALEINPFFAEAGAFLAETHILRGETDKARQVLEDLERLRPDYPPLQLDRATLAMMAGDFEEARSAYSRFVSLNRYQFARAIVRKHRVSLRKGRTEEAAKALEMNEQIDTPDGGLTTSELWRYLGLDLEGIILPRPDSGTVYSNFGLACALEGHHSQAEANWRAMLQLHRDHARTWANLAVLYAIQGNPEKAEETVRIGLQIVPGSADLMAVQAKLSLDAVSLSELDYQPSPIVLPMTHARY